MQRIAKLLRLILLTTSAAFGQGGKYQDASAAQNFRVHNNIRFASQFAGLCGSAADLGAAVNCADADLGTAPGEIWVDRLTYSTSATTWNVRNGHVLRFIQGGIYQWNTCPMIHADQGVKILGSGSASGFQQGPPTTTGTMLLHNCNGSAIVYDGSSAAGIAQGGGSIEDLTIWNVYAGKDLSGSAIDISGTVALTNQSTFILVRRVFVDGINPALRWTHGLVANGLTVGAPNGIRNIWIEDCRFDSSGTNDQDILIQNVYNPVIENVFTSNSKNGGQTIGITLTGTAGNPTTNAKLIGVDTGNLVIDFATNVQVIGGSASNIIVTENAGGQNFLFPGLLANAPTNNSPGTTAILWRDGTHSALRVSGNFMVSSTSSIQGLTASGAGYNLLTARSNDSVGLDADGRGVEAGSGNVRITNHNGNLLSAALDRPNLSAMSGRISGGPLAAGTCLSGVVPVANATTAMTVEVSPNTYPGDGYVWYGFVNASGAVTVKVCAIVGGTPFPSTYNVRVIQ